jgi:hypothetical protein|tara:strand:- start:605 stop:781 length:177 start_codon:yes stop_codon:yes gene_type:complete
MLTIEECKKCLGENCSSMTDQEVDDLKNILYQLAGFLVDDFIRNKDLKDGDRKTNNGK